MTSLAGLSTLIGYFVIFINPKYKSKIINSSLSFAGGVMITISIFDLLPESFKLITYNDLYLKILLIIIFIVVGVCFSIIFDRVVKNENFLYRVGVISLLSIILHNIPEGIITFITANNNDKLGIKLAISIALHNIPEGISIAVPLFYANKSRVVVFMFLLVAALSEPFGALIALLFNKYITINVLGYIYAVIVGLMLYISIYEILPAASRYKNLYRSIAYFILGMIIMLVSFNLFN